MTTIWRLSSGRLPAPPQNMEDSLVTMFRYRNRPSSRLRFPEHLCRRMKRYRIQPSSITSRSS
ncbi:hypothetical protein DPMN_151861 [Dreissena polymorpha]|uniref:Uncharacterized protein n=1 Tax=Dreissena polymorpha TaxID=45954 RepID=A0A9D4FFV4_DREPO|nr:hypothetical protein DPMN_151861 [Dreissena polymorpha]